MIRYKSCEFEIDTYYTFLNPLQSEYTCIYGITENIQVTDSKTNSVYCFKFNQTLTEEHELQMISYIALQCCALKLQKCDGFMVNGKTQEVLYFEILHENALYLLNELAHTKLN